MVDGPLTGAPLNFPNPGGRGVAAVPNPFGTGSAPNAFVPGGFDPDFSVNAAGVDLGYADGSLILRTGARTNTAGAYNGGGTGNKAIAGLIGLDGGALGSLEKFQYTWENIVGPGGPFFNPAGAPSVQTPYVNFIVDFDPLGAGDLKVLVMLDDSINPAITASIGTYTNPGGSNVLTYSWTAAQNVLIVGQTPPAPGGVAPNVSVGASWLENSYAWSDLVAANPDAVFRDAYTGDGGLPSGAVTPAFMIISGDSGNVTRSGKKISELLINTTTYIPAS